MSTSEVHNYLVAVIGAGPAGCYAAQYLARQGVQVALFNREVKPGGLAEYGIYPDKVKMRQGLRQKFYRILQMPQIAYLGNLEVGQMGDYRLDQLRQAGFQAIVVTTGAQVRNWLGLPGEDLQGVYHANDIVFYYNHMPGYALAPSFGRRVAVIGVGNVMLDVVNYLKNLGEPREITAFARRGPAEVKFDRQTLAPVAGCLRLEKIEAAVRAARSQMDALSLNSGPFFQLLKDAQEKAGQCDQKISLDFSFLRSPRRMIGDDSGCVREIVFERNHLALEDGRVTSVGQGVFDSLLVDTVIFSIGSRVDPGFGLPVDHGNYATTPRPRFPVDGISYEVYNPDLFEACEDVFVCGWARNANEGIVGLARKDAERGARAVLAYLLTQTPVGGDALSLAVAKLAPVEKRVVNVEDLLKIGAEEQKIATVKGLQDFSFQDEARMLAVLKASDQSG